MPFTAQNMRPFIKDFFSKCGQIRRKHLLKKSLMENFTFCAVIMAGKWINKRVILIKNYYTVVGTTQINRS